MATVTRDQAEAGTAYIPEYQGASKPSFMSYANGEAGLPDGILPAFTRPTLREFQHDNGQPRETEQVQQPAVKPESLIRLRPRMISSRRFDVLQRWEGVIVDIDGEVVNARLCDLSDPSKHDEFVEFDLVELSKSDRRIAAPGSVFYWSIGYETLLGGQIRRVSEIRLRRAPEWSHRAVDELMEKARELYAELMDSESDSTTNGE